MGREGGGGGPGTPKSVRLKVVEPFLTSLLPLHFLSPDGPLLGGLRLPTHPQSGTFCNVRESLVHRVSNILHILQMARATTYRSSII